MTLKDVWNRVTRGTDPDIEFEEFEAMLAEWEWNEHERRLTELTSISDTEAPNKE